MLARFGWQHLERPISGAFYSRKYIPTCEGVWTRRIESERERVWEEISGCHKGCLILHEQRVWQTVLETTISSTGSHIHTYFLFTFVVFQCRTIDFLTERYIFSGSSPTLGATFRLYQRMYRAFRYVWFLDWFDLIQLVKLSESK